VDNKDDTALQYEETLKRSLDSRNGPLYKIENDPRRTKVGKLIEKLSLDELPQLWNVFL
jgi:lipopolysaccharide/colanic/teichoic acid biosynthesis glycosyltransferase